MTNKNLPRQSNFKSQSDRTSAEVWLRLTAFLSLKSPNTQRTYKSVIEEWCKFLGAPAGSAEAAQLIIKANDLKAIAYRNWLEKQLGQKPRMTSSSVSERGLSERKYKPQKKDGTQSTLSYATIRKKIAALRRIYRMLSGAGFGMTVNPFNTDNLPPPPANAGQKRPTEMLDFKLVKRVVNSPDLKDPKGIRDRAVLAILFGGGLRRSEVVGIRIGDVRTTNRGTLYLRLRATKAKRDADQALPAWAASYVKDLIEQRKKQSAQGADYLFVSYRGKGGKVPTTKPLSDSGLYKLFKFYCKMANAGEFLSPHSARATAITKLLEDGIGHRQVQEFSRHASIQMVEVYDKRRIGVDDNAAKDLSFDD